MTSWAKGFGPYNNLLGDNTDVFKGLSGSYPMQPTNANVPSEAMINVQQAPYGPMTNTDVNVMSPRDQARNDIFASLGQSGYGPMSEQDANVFAQQFAQQAMPQDPAMINVQEPMNGMMTLKDLEILKGLL